MLGNDENGQIDIVGYSDANWGRSPDNQQSITGFAIYMGQAPVIFSSKKQPTVSHSSTEAEYMAVGAATVEIIWLHKILD